MTAGLGGKDRRTRCGPCKERWLMKQRVGRQANLELSDRRGGHLDLGPASCAPGSRERLGRNEPSPLREICRSRDKGSEGCRSKDRRGAVLLRDLMRGSP